MCPQSRAIQTSYRIMLHVILATSWLSFTYHKSYLLVASKNAPGLVKAQLSIKLVQASAPWLSEKPSILEMFKNLIRKIAGWLQHLDLESHVAPLKHQHVGPSKFMMVMFRKHRLFDSDSRFSTKACQQTFGSNHVF